MDELRPDVVAGKYDPAQFDPTGNYLLVNEVFYSIQGEGHNAGRAAVFVRLAKCNLACKFCDTEFETFTKRLATDVAFQVDNLSPDRGLFRNPSPDRYSRPLVILTGGEPMLQNFGPLMSMLHESGHEVAIETSGSVWSPWAADLDHICISPKVPLARIPQELIVAALARAGEVKWIVNGVWLAQFNARPADFYIPGLMNYLQPESLNPKWTTAASKLVMQDPSRYRLSLQTHKYAANP